MRFVRPMLVLTALFGALPAAADDGRRHVMTPAQKIDMVRDLPDIGAFEKDGLYFDLGYIYPIRTLNGASVASSGGPSESGFVLYHDDRYVRADSGVMSELEMVLGEDPTQGYTPPKPTGMSTGSASADPWGANGTSAAAKGQPAASSPAPSRRSGGMGWVAVIFAFIILMAVRWGRNMLIRGVFDMVSAGRRQTSSFGADYPDSQPSRDPFAEQAAAQRARLEGLSSAPTPSLTPASGGFGRKGV